MFHFRKIPLMLPSGIIVLVLSFFCTHAVWAAPPSPLAQSVHDMPSSPVAAQTDHPQPHITPARDTTVHDRFGVENTDDARQNNIPQTTDAQTTLHANTSFDDVLTTQSYRDMALRDATPDTPFGRITLPRASTMPAEQTFGIIHAATDNDDTPIHTNEAIDGYVRAQQRDTSDVLSTWDQYNNDDFAHMTQAEFAPLVIEAIKKQGALIHRNTHDIAMHTQHQTREKLRAICDEKMRDVKHDVDTNTRDIAALRTDANATANRLDDIQKTVDEMYQKLYSLEQVLASGTKDGKKLSALLSIDPYHIIYADDHENLSVGGVVSAAGIDVHEIAVSNDAEHATVGVGTIPQGENHVTIATQSVAETSRIFVTAKGAVNTQVLTVTDITDGKEFVVSTAQNTQHDIQFDWMIIQDHTTVSE